MKRTGIAALLAAMMTMAIPALASASSNNITERTAMRAAIGVAEYMYQANGVNADRAACRPQGHPANARARWQGMPFHRWVCRWHGHDGKGAEVYGNLVIIGMSDGKIGFFPVLGGLRWA